jgi:hypothetical protein
MYNMDNLINSLTDEFRVLLLFLLEIFFIYRECSALSPFPVSMIVNK